MNIAYHMIFFHRIDDIMHGSGIFNSWWIVIVMIVWANADYFWTVYVCDSDFICLIACQYQNDYSTIVGRNLRINDSNQSPIHSTF